VTARHVEWLAVAGWFVVVAVFVAVTWWWERRRPTRPPGVEVGLGALLEAEGSTRVPETALRPPSAPGAASNRHDETTEVAR